MTPMQLKKMHEKEHDSTPVFYDASMCSYDMFFHEISQHTNLEIPKFPRPSNGYKTKDEYLSDCLQWKKRIYKIIEGGVMLCPINVTEYIPKVPVHLEKGSKQYRSFNPRISPLMPLNHNAILNKLLSGEDFDEEAELPSQLPNRDIVIYKDQITKEKQWLSQLAPQEPYPFMYNSYKEFCQAYTNWNKVCNKDVKTRPYSSKKIGTLSSVSELPKSEIYEYNESKDVDNVDMMDLSWTKGLKFTGSEDAKNKIESFGNYAEGFRTDSVPLDCLVLGIDQALFSIDFKDYGYYTPSINSSVPIPHGATIPLEQNTEKKILNVFSLKEHSGLNQILDLLNVGFDRESFQSASKKIVKLKSNSHLKKRESIEILFPSIDPLARRSSRHFKSIILAPPDDSFSVPKISFLDDQSPVSSSEENLAINSNDDKLQRSESMFRSKLLTTKEKKKHRNHQRETTIEKFLRSKISPEKLLEILPFMKLSPLHFARFSIAITSLLTDSFSERLFELIYPNNIQSLYDLTSQFLALSETPVSLISPSTDSSFAISLSQLYLFSSILTYQIGLDDNLFLKLLTNKCRELSINVCKELPQHRDELWKSLESDKSNSLSRLMGMIVEIPSSNLSQILLGDDFFVRANKASQFDVGRRFLLRFIYNGKGSVVSTMVISNGGIHIENTFTPFMNIFCSLLVQLLSSYYTNYKICIQGKLLLSVFDEVDVQHFSQFLINTAKLLCDSSLIYNFSTQSYQEKLAKISQKISSSVASYVDIVSCLLPFSKVEKCCCSIVNNDKFISTLFLKLQSSDSTKELLLSWKLMFALTDFEDITLTLLSYESIQKLISTLSNITTPIIVRKFMRFLLKLWNYDSVDVRKMVAKTLTPSLGPIACLINLAPTKFEKYQKTQNLIIRFRDSVKTTTNDELVGFAQQLATHMGKRKKSMRK